MLNNKKFLKYSIGIMIIGVVYMFFFSLLQSDHLNVVGPFTTTNFGWSETKYSLPVTVGALFAIVFYLVVGTGFVKFGLRKILVPTVVIIALSTMLLAYSVSGDGNYTLYFISVAIIRCLVIGMQMGIFMLVANWFIKTRGRVMGIVTAGSPLSSIVGISILTALTNTVGLKACYFVMGIILIFLALYVGIFLKDKPEDLSLFPDGVDHAPASENDESEETIGFKELLGHKKAWQLIVSYGIFQSVIQGMMGYMAVRYIGLSTAENWAANPSTGLWGDALIWLSIGAACGIPMSFVIGFIDDKLGSIKASLILNILFFVAVIPLAIMPEGGSVPLMIVWAFGVACMTGGVPTMHPCITAYCYGRKQYQAANRWIMAIQAIPMALATSYMAAFFTAGHPAWGYYGLIVLLVISFFVLLSMRNITDANAADRAYAGNK